MNPRIVRTIARASPDVIAALGKHGVATVHEAQGRSGLLRPYMRPLFPAARLAASAVTVLCHAGDNLMIHAAIEICQPGDALVVATTSESTDGMFGELLATSCRARGIAGLVIDAGVRDVTDIIAMQFPVWTKAISAQGTVKASPGSINVDIFCAGALVQAGDVVVGDEDGVVIVRRERAAEVLSLGVARLEKEAETRQRLAKGELGVDIYGLRGIIQK
jgi:4-hydroxy-4-methyl-2-oxoglutarate aldolase